MVMQLRGIQGIQCLEQSRTLHLTYFCVKWSIGLENEWASPLTVHSEGVQWRNDVMQPSQAQPHGAPTCTVWHSLAQSYTVLSCRIIAASIMT